MTLRAFKTWEGLLFLILALTLLANAVAVPEFLTVQNQINLFQLSIEKIIVALMMTFIIINAEIDLSVASVMGLSACTFGLLVNDGMGAAWAIVLCLFVGLAAGTVNALLITWVGIPSLVVTLAGYIGYRGLARVLLEDHGLGNFPQWVNDFGQNPILGPLPLALMIFLVLLIGLALLLHRTGFGRLVFVIGNNAEVARFSGVRVGRVKATLFLMSGVMSALAGLLYAFRLGSVRGDIALGFELDIITIVLMGGVSIFGGKGSMLGVFLSILLVLNLRNGMALSNITGHVQTGVIGILLILSVLGPNLYHRLREKLKRRAA
jgi:rhamnose transport system permease protein